MTEEREPEGIWEAGWEGHEAAQRRRLAALPLAEKIRWLEEAQEIARHLQRPRKETKPRP